MQKTQLNEKIISERYTMIFSFFVTVISLTVLIGWGTGWMFLTRFTINEVAMAPSTAWVFMILAFSSFFYLRSSSAQFSRKAAFSSSIAVICLSVLFLITNIFQYYPNWEHAFCDIDKIQTGVWLGHMSMVTAILFIFCGLALLFQYSKSKLFKDVSTIILLSIFSFSLILILGYLFDAPFFYFGSFIPPAALTALSFLLISLGIISASDPDTIFIKGIMDKNISAKLLRIFLPTTLLITIIEGLIVIRVLPYFNIPPAIGISIVGLTAIAVIGVIIPVISKGIGKPLDIALEKLHYSEEKYRTLFDTMEQGVVYQDAEGDITDANAAAEKMLGHTLDQMLGKSPMHSDWRAVNEDGINLPGEQYPAMLALRTGKNIRNFLLGVFNPELKSYVWILVNSIPQFKNGSNSPSQVYSTFLDVTEQKKLEKAAQIAHQETHDLLENAQKSGLVLLSVVEDEKQAKKALTQKMIELEIFNDAAVDREIVINDLRKEINELLMKLGKEVKYEIVE